MRRLSTSHLVLFAACCVGCSDRSTDEVDAPGESPSAAEAVSAGGAPPVTPQDQPKGAAQDDARPKYRPEDLPHPTTLTAEDWPQFRGRHRDGISEATGLLRNWPESGPPILWETSVGQGYSSPSVVAGRVYLNDYDEETNTWMVRCLSLDEGEELWRYEVMKRIRPNHGITRSAPASDGGFVFAIDPKCELHCLDARNGGLIWKKFLPEEYGSVIPPWYNGQCPLLEEERIIIATGGRALLVALDKGTGQPIWETRNEEESPLTHSSVVPVEINGQRQYAYLTMSGLLGIGSEDGQLLWQFPWKFNTAVSTSALPVGEGKFFLTSGYHAQSVICQAKRNGDGWTTEEVVALPEPTKGWNSEVHTPILHRGYVYGVGKTKRGLWTCLDLEGNELWTSVGKASFGMGGYVLADGMFFVLEGKTGTLRLLDANADEYVELASCELLDGPDVWAPPVISQGKLLIRDLGRLICLDIAADSSGQVASAPGTSPGSTAPQ